MIFRSKKTLDKNYKFKDLKVYSSTEWLADGKKKYRTVFENMETTYLYCELSFYNKLFDEEDWECNILIRCYRLTEKNKREEVCEIKLDNYRVSAEDNIVMVREGWGNQSVGVFWTRGDYQWEASIDDEIVGKKKFYVENGGPVSDAENPYFEIERIRLYEGPNKGVGAEDRVYYTQFDAKDTRYVWAEFTFQNMQSNSWYCELFFNFYNDSAQLKGVTTELRRINPEEDTVTITTGWGSDTRGSWYVDKYTLEVIFMDHLVAVVPFGTGDSYVKGESPLLRGNEIHPPQQAFTDEEADEPMDVVLQRLESLVGLQKIKTRIHDYIHYLKFLQLRKSRGFDESRKINLHAVFKGNPGTGKTTIAKMLGKIYKNLGLLSNGRVHEVGRAELVGQYIGQTAPKVKELIDKARGGILFIDEAYALVRNPEDTKDYGHEVIETLVKEMSDGPGDIAIIVAGYPKEMDTFLEANPGLKSRFGMYFDFPDYIPQEMLKLIEIASEQRQIKFSKEAFDFLYKKIVEKFRSRDRTFGNARLVNSLVDEAKMNMGLRVMRQSNNTDVTHEMLQTVELADIQRIFQQDSRLLPDIQEDEMMLEEALSELNSMIGLTEIKNQIHELIKLVRFYRETGRDILNRFSLHTVFKGNPGTGKTTVARIIAKIYKALGILERGQLVECDRQSLVAGFVGQTALKTKEKIDEAIGGVLFVDEAYALASNGIGNDFGHEALETILKQMEDRRGEFIVIVAGYPENMDRFIESNPGLKSRFDKTMIFPDYSIDELYQIAITMLSSENLQLEDAEVQSYLRRQLQLMHEKRDKYFGNARSVRKFISEVIRKQHLRMTTLDRSARTEEALQTVTLNDMQNISADEESLMGQRKIGFR